MRRIEALFDAVKRKVQSKLIFEIIVHEDVEEIIIGDEVKLRQVVINLLSNAFKFTTEGFIRVHVRKRHSERETESGGGSGDSESDAGGHIKQGWYYLLFTCEDSGKGVPRDEWEEIFLSFRQGRGVVAESGGCEKGGECAREECGKNPQVTGTGLGLAISRELCRIMGGKIWIDPLRTREGEGTTIHFTMRVTSATHPLSVQHNTTTHSPRHPQQLCFNLPQAEEVEGVSMSDLSVLLAEDNRVNRMTMLKMLKTLGVGRIDAVENGREAVEVARAGEHDLYLLDLFMPVMDGVEAAKAIRDLVAMRSQSKQVARIVAWTASGKETCAEVGGEGLFDSWLVKPTTLSALRLTFGHILARASPLPPWL